MSTLSGPVKLAMNSFGRNLKKIKVNRRKSRAVAFPELKLKL
jgi:hypothetical protein